jgi:hypothetical protein
MYAGLLNGHKELSNADYRRVNLVKDDDGKMYAIFNPKSAWSATSLFVSKYCSLPLAGCGDITISYFASTVYVMAGDTLKIHVGTIHPLKKTKYLDLNLIKSLSYSENQSFIKTTTKAFR